MGLYEKHAHLYTVAEWEKEEYLNSLHDWTERTPVGFQRYLSTNKKLTEMRQRITTLELRRNEVKSKLFDVEQKYEHVKHLSVRCGDLMLPRLESLAKDALWVKDSIKLRDELYSINYELFDQKEEYESLESFETINKCIERRDKLSNSIETPQSLLNRFFIIKQ